MKAYLIVFLFSGEDFAVPMENLAQCLQAEQWLDRSEVEESWCSMD